MIAESVGIASEAAPYLISLSQWSLHRRLLGRRLPFLRRAAHFVREWFTEAPRGVEMDPLDFPVVARREFGLSAVDYIGYFYAPRLRERSYLPALKVRAEGEGVRSLLVTCADEGAIGHADPKQRARIAAAHVKWLDMAAYLGCHSVSLRAESSGTREERAARVADGLRALAEHAEPRGLNVLVENHLGFSSDSAWLKDVMARAGHARLGLLPDWGNFAAGSDVYGEVAGMMPLARAVSAKCYDFDAEGRETALDFPRLVRIAKEADYNGYLGIEYEGDRLSEADGVKACKALLERVLREADVGAKAIA
jgi:L-ribulose-5-phosphate 3-epimerase